MPGSFAMPSLLAWIVNGKYVMSLPLYRIETDLKACGATISRQDMANWMMNVHARWLAKVHERISVTTTAKANGLNPRLYVEWLLTEMPNAGELTDEVVDSFLPWSDRVPESCKLDPAAAEKAKEMPDDFLINIDPDAFDDEMANNAEEGL